MARPRDPEIDRAVARACFALLAEEGRAGLTRERIARRAGVSLPALTRRYATVEDVLLAALRAEPEPRPLPPVSSLREFLVATLHRTAAGLAEPGVRRASTELLAAAAGDTRIGEAFGDALADVRAEGHRWVEDARQRGEVRADLDADTVLDLVAGAAYYPLLWRGELLAEDHVADVVELLLAGAAPRPAT
ncbi:TetR-like C-terminal domain-containing protein [Klenkia terrae]|uniref:TetR-like C-terminal domain-containing protein n=1 Tax=Klenkia terrae TaxID=1052259 RepID=A0ABU8E7N3_9ACTN|nr:TetR-like C-terminal domain-containing protein [Klenkia terrae]SSC23526.1 DNA-binding HTH domain, TetR-type [Klenkia terrae]